MALSSLATSPLDTTALQRLSHASLIQISEPEARPGAELDAIIVPAARDWQNLITAVDLAQYSGCHLVVLCSKAASSRRVRSLFDAKGFRQGTAVRIPGVYRHELLEFETTDWMLRAERTCHGGRKSDLSTKRNLGLLIARMRGWQRVLFLDDDIRGITVKDLHRTASLLGDNGNRVAGIRVKHFPDNSVVCHARRRAGDPQDVFVTGSVLAVDCAAPFSFFPDIYNEDWLFFYDDVKAGRVASPDIHATKKDLQIKYNPFADSQRAAREEFGDLIAEGLYSFLHSADNTDFTDGNRWKEFIVSRRKLVTDIIDRIRRLAGPGHAEIEKSLLTASDALSFITFDMCVDYLAAWRRDLACWETRIAELPQMETTAEALKSLKLNGDKSRPLCDHVTRAHQGTHRGRVARPLRHETDSARGIPGGVHIGSGSRGHAPGIMVAQRIHPG